MRWYNRREDRKVRTMTEANYRSLVARLADEPEDGGRKYVVSSFQARPLTRAELRCLASILGCPQLLIAGPNDTITEVALLPGHPMSTASKDAVVDEVSLALVFAVYTTLTTMLPGGKAGKKHTAASIRVLRELVAAWVAGTDRDRATTRAGGRPGK